MRNFDGDDRRTQTGFVLIGTYAKGLAVIDPIYVGHAYRPSRAQLEAAYGADRIARDFGDEAPVQSSDDAIIHA